VCGLGVVCSCSYSCSWHVDPSYVSMLLRKGRTVCSITTNEMLPQNHLAPSYTIIVQKERKPLRARMYLGVTLIDAAPEQPRLT